MASQIDAPLFKKMFLAGAKYLDEKKEWINELNVFPVPDGDTGTKMTLTIMLSLIHILLFVFLCIQKSYHYDR